jgi:hypothetical protein
MTAVCSSRHANVTYHANESPTWNQHSMTVLPHKIKRIKELPIVLDMTKLRFVFVVALERPIGRRSHNKMDTLSFQEPEITCITANEKMIRGTGLVRR